MLKNKRTPEATKIKAEITKLDTCFSPKKKTSNKAAIINISVTKPPTLKFNNTFALDPTNLAWPPKVEVAPKTYPIALGFALCDSRITSGKIKAKHIASKQVIEIKVIVFDFFIIYSLSLKFLVSRLL